MIAPHLRSTAPGVHVRTMLDRHYAGVIPNWDGERVPVGEQIRRARAAVDSGAVGAG